MPIIKYDEMKMKRIEGEGIKNVEKAIVISKTEGWGDHVLRVFRIGSGGCTPRHRHAWEHVNYVISGRGRLRIGASVQEIGERDFAFVPPDTDHQFENPYGETFEFICIVPDRGEY